MTPDDPRHGSPAGRKRHVRDGETPCDPCRAAAAKYQNLRALDAHHGKPRSVSPVGAQRRIQALVVLGWSYPDLGARLGVSGSQVHKWARGQAFIRSTTADRIATVYDALSMTPAPTTRNARYARTVARRNGWAPPLAWDDIDRDPAPVLGDGDDELDPVVVDRILGGDWRLHAGLLERVAVLARWEADGLPDNEVERRTGWNVSRDVRPHLPRTETAA